MDDFNFFKTKLRLSNRLFNRYPNPAESFVFSDLFSSCQLKGNNPTFAQNYLDLTVKGRCVAFFGLTNGYLRFEKRSLVYTRKYFNVVSK